MADTPIYFKIYNQADTTETGLLMSVDYIRSHGVGGALLRDWCRDEYGPEMQYVQGVAPCAGWYIRDNNKDEWLEARPKRWGGYPTRTRRLVLTAGRGKVLSEETDGKPTDQERIADLERQLAEAKERNAELEQDARRYRALFEMPRTINMPQLIPSFAADPKRQTFIQAKRAQTKPSTPLFRITHASNRNVAAHGQVIHRFPIHLALGVRD